MSRKTLEQRVAVLEEKVEALLANHATTGRVNDWRRTSGAFTGDDLMKEIFEEGRKIREAERKRARRQGGKKARAAPRRKESARGAKAERKRARRQGAKKRKARS
jgi:hypothetical protein